MISRAFLVFQVVTEILLFTTIHRLAGADKIKLQLTNLPIINSSITVLLIGAPTGAPSSVVLVILSIMVLLFTIVIFASIARYFFKQSE